MTRRAGYALVELVTSAALLGIVAAACGALLHSQTQLLRNIAERAAVDETLRAARAVVGAETWAIDSADVRAVASDSLALRVFRGWGIVCHATASRAAIRYRGLREPDAEKDSLLLFGSERALAFRNLAETPSCAAQSDEQLFAIAPSFPVRKGALLLVFESGAYHLSGNALRYRRGAEGRQPLTDELIDHRRSRFIRDANGVHVVLHAR